jgi:hypothetical protein
MHSYRKHEPLRQKLLRGEPLNAGEATGDTVSKMLKEIDEADSIANPYCLASTEVQQCISELRERMPKITERIQRMWTEMKFINRTVSFSDTADIS